MGILLSVAEMAEARHGHSHAVLVAICHGIIVADGAAGLHHGVNTGLVRDFNTVGEGKEGIRCHNCAAEVETEAARLVNGLAQGVHAGDS